MDVKSEVLETENAKNTGHQGRDVGANVQGPPPPIQMLQFLAGSFVARSLGVAAELDIAGKLTSQPQTVDELAQATSCRPDSLARLLRALASVGVFRLDNGRYHNTPLSETLIDDAPGSLRAMTMFLCGSTHWSAWGELLHSVQTGQSAFEKVLGSPPFAYMERDQAFAKTFNDAMQKMSEQELAILPCMIHPEGCRSIVDIGGGTGALLQGILQENPELNGILFDSPEVVEQAKGRLPNSAVKDRCELVAGNFFERVPTADAYLLKYILHDWSDQDAGKILSTIHRASKPGARLFILDPVLKPANEPDFAKLLDVQVLMFYGGGRERTQEDLASLIQASGFELRRTIETPSLVSILEAVRI